LPKATSKAILTAKAIRSSPTHLLNAIESASGGMEIPILIATSRATSKAISNASEGIWNAMLSEIASEIWMGIWRMGIWRETENGAFQERLGVCCASGLVSGLENALENARENEQESGQESDGQESDEQGSDGQGSASGNVFGISLGSESGSDFVEGCGSDLGGSGASWCPVVSCQQLTFCHLLHTEQTMCGPCKKSHRLHFEQCQLLSG